MTAPDAGLELRVAHAADADRARRAARDLALRLRFEPSDAEAIALAAMELATNLVRYAAAGELSIVAQAGARGVGVRLESRDRGPGIANVELALQDGFSTGGGLGGGLPAVRRLMDTFEIESDPSGTRVVACKWPTPTA